MLSSVTEAEDLLQDVWLRWQAYDRSTVANPEAFLATTTTRLAINVLQSAWKRRETYIGPWLPEPVDTEADPYLGAERAEALQFASLLLMERLTSSSRRSPPGSGTASRSAGRPRTDRPPPCSSATAPRTA
jgi:RNA polymerase sigma-70 factor (ECF subfamily)